MSTINTFMNVKNYWANNWKANTAQYQWSFQYLIDSIDPQERILDIGCGHSPLKQYFPNLYGIDPYIETGADEIVGWDDYEPAQEFDRYFVLGSLNFGTQADIERQVEKLSYTVKPGQTVHWRQNPFGNDHPWEGSDIVPFYAWSLDKNIDLCYKYGFKLEKWIYDHGKKTDRHYVEWIKQ